jgi:hypothetical protein
MDAGDKRLEAKDFCSFIEKWDSRKKIEKF